MSNVEQHIRNRTPLAVQLTSGAPGKVTWLGVYSLDPKKEKTIDLLRRHSVSLPAKSDVVLRIRKFDVDTKINTGEIWIGEESLENKEDWFAFDVDTLVEDLGRLGVTLDALRPQGETEYPI